MSDSSLTIREADKEGRMVIIDMSDHDKCILSINNSFSFSIDVVDMYNSIPIDGIAACRDALLLHSDIYASQFEAYFFTYSIAHWKRLLLLQKLISTD